LRNGKETLWRVSIEGGAPVQINAAYASWADVSPDGKLIACAWGKSTDASNRRIAVIGVEDGKIRKIFQTAKHGLTFNRLRWSPDGKSIVYKDNIQGMWRQDLDKESPQAIEGFNETRVFHFAFSTITKNLIYSGGIEMREIVILNNFRDE
jgi:Tol biopolymer transport system component